METLLRDNYDRMYLAARRILNNSADAYDATQEACIRVSNKIQLFKFNSSFSTWAYRVASNCALDFLRSASRHNVVPLLPDTEVASDLKIDSYVTERDEIDRAMADLEIDFRMAIVMRDVMGLEYKEIADQLGIPVGTVRSRIARGRSKLAEMLTTGNNDVGSQRLTDEGEQ